MDGDACTIYVVKNDGTLYGWGGKDYLGIGTEDGKTQSTPVKILDNIAMPGGSKELEPTPEPTKTPEPTETPKATGTPESTKTPDQTPTPTPLLTWCLLQKRLWWIRNGLNSPLRDLLIRLGPVWPVNIDEDW